MTPATAQLHGEYRRTGDERVRLELINQYQGLAQSMVSRFCRRPEEREDLEQVVQIALVRALERFEPDRNIEFSTYAWATVRGEIKRYYRDHSWRVRVPRRLQEHYLVVAAAVDDLSHLLHRSPNYRELAGHTGLSLDEVVEAVEVRRAYRTVSLDGLNTEDGSEQPTVGGPDPGLVAAEDRSLVVSLVERLPARERRIVMLRFVHEMTQSEIAAEVGLSQMQVSRLLARSLDRLRHWASAPEPVEP